MTRHKYSPRPCNDYGSSGCLPKGQDEPGFCKCKADADRLALFESLLREAEKWCPRSLTGQPELANRIEEALRKSKEAGDV